MANLAKSPVERIRALLHAEVDRVNPFALLQLALEFFVNVELMRGCLYVHVDEDLEGFTAVAGHPDPGSYTGRGETALAEVKILLPWRAWRESVRYRQWRHEKSGGLV